MDCVCVCVVNKLVVYILFSLWVLRQEIWVNVFVSSEMGVWRNAQLEIQWQTVKAYYQPVPYIVQKQLCHKIPKWRNDVPVIRFYPVLLFVLVYCYAWAVLRQP